MPDLRESLDLLDMSVAASDRPSYIENIGETLLQNQLDALEQSYAQHGTIGPDPMYDEEGNIIPEELWGPDISFTPLMTKAGLTSAVKNILNPRESQILKNVKDVAATKVLRALNKLEHKITPRMDKYKAKGHITDLSTGEDPKAILELIPSGWAKLLEGRTRSKLFKKLATSEEFERFQRTYPEFKGTSYDEYLDFIKDKVWISDPAKHTWAKPMDIYRNKTLTNWGEFQTATGEIAMRPSLSSSAWQSTLRHEIKHDLDFHLTRYSNKDYTRLRGVFDEGLKPSAHEELKNWELFKSLAMHKGGDKINKKWLKDVGGVRRIKYLKEPTETLARLLQIRTKGIGQTVSTMLGKDIKPLNELKEIYPDKTIAKWLKEYWIVAPLMLDDEMYKDLK